MKKRFVIILCMSVILITCWGCGSGNSKVDQTLKNQAKQSDDSEESDASQQSDVSEQSADGGDATGTEGIDVDLTRLSSTMVYSEVYNMMTVPEDYPELGTDVVITGDFDTYSEGDSQYCILRNAIME